MTTFKNFKISHRLTIVISAILVLVLFTNILNISFLSKIRSNSELAKNESLVFAMYAKEFQLSVIQVQQWLTDISATRAAEGFDDGFGEAQVHFEAGNESLDKFQAMFSEENDSEMLEFIETLRGEFSSFYEMGIGMAKAYIEGGPEQGNVFMEKFDPYAATISESVDKLIKSQTDELNMAMDQVLQSTKRSSRISLTVLAAIMVIGISGAYILIISITRPVEKLLSRITEVSQGDGDLTMRLDVDSRDELGQVAAQFNGFLEKLQSIISKLKEASSSVSQASGSISSTSEQMAAGAEEQQAQLSEVATSVEEMSAMILETSNNTESTQQGALEANSAAGRGQEKVAKTIEGIEGIASIVGVAAEQISTLKVRSEEIGEVINVIDEIADQTNLLALNANIEAARAGDAGRGFAVVADEVRKLAERTVSATGDISVKINQIQEDISESVTAMGHITQQSADGQTLASESGVVLTEITASIETVSSAISQVAGAAIEQSSGVEEISKNIEGISTVSKQAASSAQDLAHNATKLNSEVSNLDAQLSQFKV